MNRGHLVLVGRIRENLAEIKHTIARIQAGWERSPKS